MIYQRYWHHEGVIVAATKISEYSSCLDDNKVTWLQSEGDMQCTKCSLQQHAANTIQHISTNLMISVDADYIQLTAFNSRRHSCTFVDGPTIQHNVNSQNGFEHTAMFL